MTNAELAILSLISETPRHGYEIEQIIEKRGMREWTEIGFSSIYYLLNKLEKAGQVESQLIPTQGRGSARRVYQITAGGVKLGVKPHWKLSPSRNKITQRFYWALRTCPSYLRNKLWVRCDPIVMGWLKG